MSKIIKLIIAIIIPLIAAVFMGVYEYNYNDYPESTANTGFYSEYIDQAPKDPKSQFVHYLKYISYQYVKEPVYHTTLKNKNNEDIAVFEIYQIVYNLEQQEAGDEGIEELVTKKVPYYRYYYVVYNVNYTNSKNSFDLGEFKLTDVGEPYFGVVAKLTKTKGGDQEDRTVVALGDSAYIVDKGSNPRKSEVTDAYNMLQFGELNDIEDYEKEISFTVNVNADIEGYEENEGVMSSDVATFELTIDRDYNSEDEKLIKGYEYNNKEAGYFKWVFGRYIWWESLIAMVLVGIITMSFYFVWTVEDDGSKDSETKKKRK